MNKVYFPAGVKSVWIIVPVLQLVMVRTAEGKTQTFTHGVISDPVTKIDIPFTTIFR